MRAVARLIEIIETLRAEMARAYQQVEDAYHRVTIVREQYCSCSLPRIPREIPRIPCSTCFCRCSFVQFSSVQYNTILLRAVSCFAPSDRAALLRLSAGRRSQAWTRGSHRSRAQRARFKRRPHRRAPTRSRRLHDDAAAKLFHFSMAFA